ncbi:hypothetical protein PP175_25640 (plasmid) [Aneurinibacillus sp. Ricciae_BoGa-3]|uniref:hypothetical protein n=1 Tax=Aneurinibacillus sp. Ricciae_BoGa-3 TaxID=3022697 RepID=UPI0023420471|nr:hypothetical protein [Aneurinibacillus sp. Ricciae_BoGa-3]WCK57453.1 hypothetical protein PP175_25640 [Aneurinibacillus sp. Ricciae_BoGa-3]
MTWNEDNLVSESMNIEASHDEEAIRTANQLISEKFVASWFLDKVTVKPFAFGLLAQRTVTTLDYQEAL